MPVVVVGVIGFLFAFDVLPRILPDDVAAAVVVGSDVVGGSVASVDNYLDAGNFDLDDKMCLIFS